MYIDAFKRILFERLNCLKRMCVCQRQGSSFAMSKGMGKKVHWRSKVQDSFVPLLGASGELGISIGGGADYGEFPFVTSAPAGVLTVGDVILEICGTPVLGMTLGDVRGVLNTCPHPIRIKTASPGSSLCKDLRLYLSKCFTPGSVDSQLQQVIRENLYLRTVPCTTRRPRVGDISGVDYNFVSIEEFFSLEESGALLESGKFKGNYYGTPRPVHISAESPPITYQEHRNLLRNFRTRSKSLSNLEKCVEEGVNSEDDNILSGGLAGVSSSFPPSHHSAGRPRASSSGGDGRVMQNGVIGGRSSGRIRGVIADPWEQAFSEPGESLYIERSPKRTSWQSPHLSRRETLHKNEWFTDQPDELRGFPVHTHLTKGTRGFGFNIVGGSRPREFLQVYSVTASGPPALKTGDILVYVGNVCVLGVSHKEVVEMLKSVPVGQMVDVEVRRGYPMLYNSDGCPKQHSPRVLDTEDPPTTTQPQSYHPLHRLPTPTPENDHFTFNGIHDERSFMESGVSLDANGNATTFASRPLPSYRRASLSYAASSSPVRQPRSMRGLARLQSLDPTLASQSDSEVVSAIGSHRASMIRNHNNNSLSKMPHPLHYGTSKSSESDLSTCTLSGSRLPLPYSPRRPSSSPGGPRSAHSRLFRPSTTHMRLSPTPNGSHHHGFNGFHGNSSPTASSISSPGAMSVGSGPGGFSEGELVPVALSQTEGDRGLGFTVMAGGLGGRMAVVKRIVDRKQCNSLQPGDAIVKINGANVQSLSCAQVQIILQEHTKLGEVILLVHRGGIYHSTGSTRRLPPPHLRPPPLPDSSADLPESLPMPRTAFSTPPSPAPTRSSLIQSTSFLESIPVTLTMEPKDWISTGLEEEVDGLPVPVPVQGKHSTEPTRLLRGFDVELRRKLGEGFGFVIASQDVENAASLLPHRFVTIRRGSPAAKSGQIRPGDRLEAVEGRSVVTLPHRELAQILRRAGNTLRLTIVPRPSTYSSTLSEPTDFDTNHRSRKGQRSRQKHDSRYYSVDLDRGPSGFGFSLRGGSEYNMGLYVLGLMEGGPASRSQKIQVSDQLVEINGDTTAGMSHSQAVEQIRRGGHRIHLVLKRGNGYVPDYGREHRITSPSILHHPKEQGLAAVDSAGRRGRSSKPKRKSRSRGGHRDKEAERRRRTQVSGRGGEGGSGLQSPNSEQRGTSRDDQDRKSRRRRKSRSKSLPRDGLRNTENSDTEKKTGRARVPGEDRGRTRSEERVQKQHEEKSEEDEEQEVLVTAAEEAIDEAEQQMEDKVEEREKVGEDEENEEEDVILPIPVQTQKLPRPKQNWEAESVINWDMTAEYRELRIGEEEEEEEEERSWSDIRDLKPLYQEDNTALEPLPIMYADRKPFSFLTSSLSTEQPADDDSASEGSQSESILSAASISGLSVAAGRRSPALPGPWHTPSRQRLAEVAGGGT
ncbi:membrane-associated guanylate kinase, WW and PDZ domain-containing protein 2 isoform X2 [Gouania willdenowi]|uniref:membrane-associated guanylate kinase, WW and PDZ domain-containing protein 2 isoform X2 n=1 Tax=Gouania willdenowi TaxID=441366 RepID=UPI0010560117|nr:membrane-associated guanylate kinase, WW and PDZ domain-containing protein 2-like isoform X2 [Gouania willdenowi]